jgi:hypothetical protein
MAATDERSLGDMVGDILEQCIATHWPPEGAPVIKTDVELLLKIPVLWDEDKTSGYRVRKVEWTDEMHFRRYFLSWQTGEWVPVPEGTQYPEETFLDVERLPVS